MRYAPDRIEGLLSIGRGPSKPSQIVQQPNISFFDIFIFQIFSIVKYKMVMEVFECPIRLRPGLRFFPLPEGEGQGEGGL